MIGQVYSNGGKVLPNTRGIPAVLLGDSITALNTTGSVSSRNGGQTTRGYFNWVQFKMKHPFYCPSGYDGNLPFNTGSISGTGRPVGYNAGIGSDKLPGMLGRLQSDVIAYKPAFCFFMGGTNDLQGGDSAANIKANIATVIDRLLAANIHPVVIGILPRNATDAAGADFDATRRLMRCDINRATKNYCLAKGATYVNPDIAFCDPATGDAKTGYTVDGVHPSSVGAEALGDAIIEALPAGLLPPNRELINNVYDVYDATNNPFGNILPNAKLAGTAGGKGTGCTGNVADSWTAEMTSGTFTSTAVCSKSTLTLNSNQLVTQKFIVTHNGAGLAAETLRFRHSSPATITTAAANGVWMECGAYIKVSAPTGAKNLISAMMLIEDQANGVLVRAGLYRDSGVYMNGVAREGFIGMIPRQLSGTNGVKVSLQFVFDNTIAGETTIEVTSPFTGVCSVTPPITYY